MKKFFQKSSILVTVVVCTLITTCGCSKSENIEESSTIEISTTNKETTKNEETTKIVEKYQNYIVTSNYIYGYLDTKESKEKKKFYKNTVISATDTSDREWKKAKDNDNNIFYVRSNDIELFNADIFEYQQYQVVNDDTKYIMVLVNSGNIRNLPNTNSDVVGIAYQGDIFEVLGTTKNNWYVLDYNNQYCYISSEVSDEITLDQYVKYGKKIEKSNFDSYKTELIGEYTTNYAPVATNRGYNVEKASAEIDSLLIPSGMVFNWCRDMGPCGKDEGYKESIEISNGEYVTGYGGGICQVSSTFCAAVLSATEGDFKFIARKSHSKAQKYIPHELDATVSYPTANLIISNNNDYDVILKSFCNAGNITVEIYKIIK